MKHTCKKIPTIPQFTGTCWFKMIKLEILRPDVVSKKMEKSENYF